MGIRGLYSEGNMTKKHDTGRIDFGPGKIEELKKLYSPPNFWTETHTFPVKEVQILREALVAIKTISEENSFNMEKIQKIAEQALEATKS